MSKRKSVVSATQTDEKEIAKAKVEYFQKQALVFIDRVNKALRSNDTWLQVLVAKAIVEANARVNEPNIYAEVDEINEWIFNHNTNLPDIMYYHNIDECKKDIDKASAQLQTCREIIELYDEIKKCNSQLVFRNYYLVIAEAFKGKWIEIIDKYDDDMQIQDSTYDEKISDYPETIGDKRWEKYEESVMWDYNEMR